MGHDVNLLSWKLQVCIFPTKCGIPKNPKVQPLAEWGPTNPTYCTESLSRNVHKFYHRFASSCAFPQQWALIHDHWQLFWANLSLFFPNLQKTNLQKMDKTYPKKHPSGKKTPIAQNFGFHESWCFSFHLKKPGVTPSSILGNRQGTCVATIEVFPIAWVRASSCGDFTGKKLTFSMTFRSGGINRPGYVLHIISNMYKYIYIYNIMICTHIIPLWSWICVVSYTTNYSPFHSIQRVVGFHQTQGFLEPHSWSDLQNVENNKHNRRGVIKFVCRLLYICEIQMIPCQSFCHNL